VDDRTEERLSFLAERRAVCVQRYDILHSRRYDEHWGAISASHARCVQRLMQGVRTGGEVLDAGCGTGKYWPIVLAAGLRVVGVDQSAAMLARARGKHPNVSNRVLALQDLVATDDLLDRFDGLLCVDALENVGPEHWPDVAAGLARVLRRGSPAYLTVELPPGPLPAAVDPRQVRGEVMEGGGYHFYPSRQQVSRWLNDAGLVTDDAAEGDDYWHLLLTRA
jgi:SAM-dependent methyltransferase